MLFYEEELFAAAWLASLCNPKEKLKENKVFFEKAKYYINCCQSNT